MTTTWQLVLCALAISVVPAAAWELPPDNGTMGKESIAAIVAGNDYPETSGYRQSIDFIDFTMYGQKFTVPLLRNHHASASATLRTIPNAARRSSPVG